MSAKFVMKKSTLITAAVFVAITVSVAGVFYIFDIDLFSKPDQWRYQGTFFNFRTNIADSNVVSVTPSCESVFNTFNSIYLNNITIYFKDDPADYSFFTVENVELRDKMARYYLLSGADVFIDTRQWTLDAYPKGSPAHPRIYLIGPTSATSNSIELIDNTVVVSGRTLQELDLATIKAMVCIFGIRS